LRLSFNIVWNFQVGEIFWKKKKMGKLFTMLITKGNLIGTVKKVNNLSSLYVENIDPNSVSSKSNESSNSILIPTLQLNRLSIDSDDSSLDSISYVSSLSSKSRSSFSSGVSHFSDEEKSSLFFSPDSSSNIDPKLLLNPSNSQSPNVQYCIASNPLSPNSCNGFQTLGFNQRFSSQPTSTFIENDEVARLTIKKSDSFKLQNVKPAIFGNQDICIKLIKRIESLKKENEALREELNGGKKIDIQKVLEKKKNGKIKSNIKRLVKSVEIPSVNQSCSSFSSFSPSMSSIFVPHTILSTSPIHDTQPTQLTVVTGIFNSNNLINQQIPNSYPNSNRCYNCGEKGHLYVNCVSIFYVFIFF
jgi:hypothetical protein